MKERDRIVIRGPKGRTCENCGAVWGGRRPTNPKTKTMILCTGCENPKIGTFTLRKRQPNE